MKRMVCSMIAAFAACSAETGWAGVEFRQHLGRQLSVQHRLVDEDGARFDLSKAVAETEVILVPGLFRCDKVCREVRERLAESLKKVPLTVGKDYRIIFFSVNPAEPRAAARQRKQEWLNRFGTGEARSAVHFLLGDEAGVAALARQVGFGYRIDQASGEYRHPAGCVVLTRERRISRYLLGTRFPPHELELALRTAASGRVGREELTAGVLCPDGSWGSQIVRYTVRILGIGLIVGLLYSMVQGRRNLQGG